MRTSRKGRGLAPSIVAVGVVVACEPIVGTPAPAVPVNACPAHPCAAYQQLGPAPTCNAGACTVPATTTDLLLVIGLPTDAYLAPGRTYVATLASASPALATCQAPTCCQLQTNCAPPVCRLPLWVQDASSYFVARSEADPTVANWNLGNNTVTTLPVQATFRLRYSPSASSPSVDALDLGLPVEPVLANSVPNPNLATPPFGPNGSAPVQFQTYLPPGCYERTLQPLSPLSRVFPPEIKSWSSSHDDVSPEGTLAFDTTQATDKGTVIPQFDFQRAEGLDGWTAYMRDPRTKRVFSNVVPLTGSLAPKVTLLTEHVPSGTDALTGLEVVLAPPSGQPLPTEFFVPVVAISNMSMPGTPPSLQLSALLPYASLPTPVTVSGRIRTPDGAPVPADVYFTATDISDRTGQKFRNFEFSTHVATTRDPRTSESTYSVLLPQGDYQIVVRPTDGVNAMKTVLGLVGGQGNEMTGEDFYVTPLVPVSGHAVVADERPLAEAIVEALPTQCSANAGDAAATADSSDACLPNPAHTVTGSDGSFRLMVDPGEYLLRIRPRDGSRLPWKISRLSVGTAPQSIPMIRVPAPISMGMQLTDDAKDHTGAKVDNPVPNAVVRVFTDPTQGAPGAAAVELGRAVTDAEGNYEMYIAPLDQ